MLIGHVDVLPSLFEKVFVPRVVHDELRHDEAPESVRRWIAQPPSWLEVVSSADREDIDAELLNIDDGEHAAILLAMRIGAKLLLMDDRDGVHLARSRGPERSACWISRRHAGSSGSARRLSA